MRGGVAEGYTPPIKEEFIKAIFITETQDVNRTMNLQEIMTKVEEKVNKLYKVLETWDGPVNYSLEDKKSIIIQVFGKADDQGLTAIDKIEEIVKQIDTYLNTLKEGERESEIDNGLLMGMPEWVKNIFLSKHPKEFNDKGLPVRPVLGRIMEKLDPTPYFTGTRSGIAQKRWVWA